MTKELKQCPFRKKREEHSQKIVDAMGETWVLCSCGASSPMFSGANREDKAVDFWNTRYKRTCHQVETEDGDLKCSCCGNGLYTDFDVVFKRVVAAPYCPHCGAEVCGAEVVDGD